MAIQSDVLKTARAEALRALINTGGPSVPRLRIYSGSQPGSLATPATGTLLAVVLMVYPVPASVNGVLTLTSSADAPVLATGTAGYARLISGDLTEILEMSCGVTGSGSEVELSAVGLYAGGFVRLPSMTLT